MLTSIKPRNPTAIAARVLSFPLEHSTAQPIFLTFDFRAGGQCIDVLFPEIAACFGTDVTPKAIREQVSKTFKVGAKLQLDARAQGLDPKDVDLVEALKGSTTRRKGTMTL